MFPASHSPVPEANASAETTPPRAYWVLLVLVTLLGAFLRFWHLGTRGFMIDEGFSWGVAHTPWNEFVHGLLTRTADMTLHYFLLHLWTALGNSEFALRSLSAIFGIAVLPTVAEVGRRLYSWRAGIIAAALLAVSTFAIKFAQEIRAYPMVMFLVALSWLQLIKVVRDPSRRNFFWFSIITLAAVYSHVLVGLNVVAQVATLLCLPVSRIGWKRVFESLLTIFIGVFPAFVYTLQHSGDGAWVKATDKAIVIEFLDSVTGRTGNSVQMYAVIVLFLVVCGLFFPVWLRKRQGFEVWTASIPLVGTLLPFLGLVAVAVLQPIFVPRYIAYVVIPMALGFGWACSKMKPAVSYVAAVGLLALYAWPLPAYYRETSWQDFRGAVAYVGERRAANDGLVVWEPMARPAVEYYGTRVENFPEFIFPRSGDHFHADDMLMRPDPFTLPAAFAKHDRIWVIFDLDKSPEEYNMTPALYFERVIQRTHKQVATVQFKNVRVEEFVKQPSN